MQLNSQHDSALDQPANQILDIIEQSPRPRLNQQGFDKFSRNIPTPNRLPKQDTERGGEGDVWRNDTVEFQPSDRSHRRSQGIGDEPVEEAKQRERLPLLLQTGGIAPGERIFSPTHSVEEGFLRQEKAPAPVPDIEFTVGLIPDKTTLRQIRESLISPRKKDETK